MGVDRRSDGFVLCVGIDPSDGFVIARSVGTGAVVVMVPDAEAARRILDRSREVLPDRSPTDGAEVIRSGSLVLDRDGHLAHWRGREFDLHGREFDLLATLASTPGRVWTFADLTATVWGHTYLGDPSAVTSAVKRLRRRLREQHVGVAIESVRGVGFRIDRLPQQRGRSTPASADGRPPRPRPGPADATLAGYGGIAGLRL
jgi:DNA-binding winged helix-turn-helix (wHTH) protein